MSQDLAKNREGPATWRLEDSHGYEAQGDYEQKELFQPPLKMEDYWRGTPLSLPPHPIFSGYFDGIGCHHDHPPNNEPREKENFL